jgi:hypothetical protein
VNDEAALQDGSGNITAASLAPAPFVTIEIPFEGVPTVRSFAMREGDAARMWDWVESNPQVLDLICRAVALDAELRDAA